MVMENQPNHSPGVVSTTDSLQKQQQVAFKETINDIINVNKFLLVSINRCMDYAKTADGIKLMPKYETCHVEESIRTVLHCLPSAEDKEKVRFTLQSAAMCSHILTDKQWMQENILCLVSNAVKFTPQGVIDLRVSLTNDDGEVNVLFEVEDNGVGISKEMQSKLFAPFQQAQKNAGGTGLGLYSLSQRIQALGGKYGVRDRLDGKQGSLFWFNFPYRPDAITASMTRWDSGIIPLSSHSSSQKPVWSSMAAVYPTPTAVKKRPSRDGNDEEVTNIFPRSADESWLKCDSSESNETVAPAARFRQAGTSTTSSNIPIVSVPKVIDDFRKNSSIVTKSPPKYRVLLADDSKAIRSVLVKILHRGGHEVVSVTNGLEAMQIIESNETEGQNFDAVILDLHMPVLDGFETMKRIREQEQIRKLDIESFDDGSYTHPKQFIIGCSANNDAETWSEMKECGANAVLLKPFTLAQFELCMADRFKSESPSF
jgi:CheY-like chemotaxis protein